MTSWLARLRPASLRTRMLVIFVGGLCLAQALYVFLGNAQVHANFNTRMIVRAVEKFVLQAEAVVADPDVTLPARTASPLTSMARAWLAPESAVDAAPLPRSPRVEARVRRILQEHGIPAETVEAVYGVRPRSEIERTGRQREFGRWALPTYTVIAARLPGVPGWLNVRIGSHPPPPPITPESLLLNLGIVAGVGLIGIALVATQVARACRDLGQAAARVGTSSEGAVAPVAGPAEFQGVIEALNNTSRRIAELLVEKDVMLGAIGHDLRTPLTSLRLRLDRMEPVEERERGIATLEDTAHLLDDILELARTGRSEALAQRYDLSALAADVVADEQDLGHDVELDCDERVIAHCQPASIRRLLQNLIGNAVKYAGHARVSLGNGESAVRLVVEDNGPGVPEGHLDALLLPFRRGEASRNRTTGGSGLGLAISRAIARSHGGDLSLSNKHPHGLRIEVSLPA